jgi:hypothetical protein
LIAHPRVIAGDYDTTFVESHASELTSARGDHAQQLQDALLLAAVSAQADLRPHHAAASASTTSRWRDAPPKPVTRYR